MPGKPYIKTGNSTWTKVKRIYIKSGGQTWAPVRKAYIKVRESGSVSGRWAKFYDTTSNRPFIEGNDRPKIRLNTFRTNSTYDPTGTANDPVNPVVEAPPVQQMGPPTTTPTSGWPSGTIGNHLWGYDGDWRSGNGSAITYTYQWLYNLSGDRNDNTFDPAFSPAYSSTTNASNTSSTGRADMLTNNSTYLGRGFPGQSGTEGDYFDKNFLTFRVVATNSAGSVAEESDTQLYIVRQRPSGTIDLINTSVDVPETLSASFTYSNEWYRKPNLSNSYIEWFAIDSAGEALTTSNRVAIEYLSNVIGITGTTTKSGTVYHNATVPNKFYTVRITLNNSNTESAVIPISGFIPNSPFTQEDSTAPGSALSVTTLNILDYYNQKGTDNRGYIPVAGLFKIQSNVTGVDGSTTYRIRYRMYNWQNGSYYGMDGTNYGTAASSAWTTRTGSNSSFGFGGTLINNITVSGTTATLTHNESISSSSFGSTTYDGGQDRWQIEIEVSALKNSVRKYYADVVGGIPYYVSRAATSTLSASPSNAQVNQNVTLSGSFGGLGGGSSYPRQYRIYYGDGTDSGYLPIGEYSYGTANPSFSVIKQYSSNGEYFPYIITMPDYQTTSTSLVVAAALTAPTSTSIVSVSRLNNTQTRVVVSSSGGSGPYYQLYWISSSTAPTTANYDAASTTSTVTEDYEFSDGITYYFYIRSSNQNLGNTTVNGTATAGTYSAYGPATGAAFYTFAQPSGTVSVSPSSGTAGTTTFTANPSVSASPSAEISYQWQYNDQGSLWLAAPNSITSPFNTTSSTYTPPSNYNSIYGSLLRCQITANNGVGTQLVTTAAVTVSTPVLAPTNSTIPTLSPTSISVGTQLSAGIGTWNNNPTSYDIRIYRGTANVGTFETLVASRSGSSTANLTYTVTQADYDSGQRYFRTFVDASNSGGSSGLIAGQERGPIATPVSIPSGGSVSLTGGSTAGSTITAITSGWSGSPTSYEVYITTALSPNIPTSSSSRVSFSSGTSTSYVITSSDAISPVNIFRAFATASNSAGTSGIVQSSNTITTTSSAPATAPGTPGTPTNGWTSGTSYPFSWTAPGAGTVAGGGAATINNYSMRIYEASNSSGTGATLISTFNTGSSSSSYTYTSPNASLYYAASVAAINSAGLQGPYSGISQYK